MNIKDISIGKYVKYDNEICRINDYFYQRVNQSPSTDVIVTDCVSDVQVYVNHEELEELSFEEYPTHSEYSVEEHYKKCNKINDSKCTCKCKKCLLKNGNKYDLSADCNFYKLIAIHNFLTE